MTAPEYIPCDLCGSDGPRLVMESKGLDGPLVACRNCGLKYVGRRASSLAYGGNAATETTERVRQANLNIRHLGLEEERRLAVLNARWRLELIRKLKPSGQLLEIGCARGDFLAEAKEYYDVRGVEPNPELAEFAARVAPVYRDVIERTPWSGFDVIASFHVIEHSDSPRRFVTAAAERIQPGGLLVLETPDIDSPPFRLMRGRWRQFIPEHYYFFDRRTMTRLLEEHGFRVDRITHIGKHASIGLVANRLSRYFRPLGRAENLARSLGLSGLTIRVNPLDIMLVFATRGR